MFEQLALTSSSHRHIAQPLTADWSGLAAVQRKSDGHRQKVGPQCATIDTALSTAKRQGVLDAPRLTPCLGRLPADLIQVRADASEFIPLQESGVIPKV